MTQEGSNSSTEKIWTISNIITLTRICLVPLFVVVLLSPWPEWFGVINIISNPVKAILAAIVFIIISCTDWIDGYLARSRGEVTDFGKFLDPLADKILVTAALIALVELQALPAWPVLVILTREFIVSGIRMLAASKGFVIAASWYGKAKTVFQIIAVVMFLVKDYAIQYSNEPVIENPFYIASWIVMIIALILTVLSMIDYINKARPLLWPSSQNKDAAIGDHNDSDEPSRSAFKDDIDSGSISNEPDVSLDLESQIDMFSHSQELIDILRDENLTICTAESLTGGLICAALTSVPGSSEVVKGSFVTYAISAKESLLGVDEELLRDKGAVDGEVAKQMAKGAAYELKCDMSLSATGIAGPGGAEPGKPVGTVYIGVLLDKKAYAFECHFEGDRDSVRSQTVDFAIEKAIDLLKQRA